MSLARRPEAKVPGRSATAEYNPFHDKDFLPDVINHLRDHKDEWCHPGRAVLEARGGECLPIDLAVATYKAVCIARRMGDVIDGDRQLGYRYRGWRRGLRVSRRGKVFAWPPEDVGERSHQRARRAREQLTIPEGRGVASS